MITARGVTKRFGRLAVLRDLDLDIPRGQVTAIVGPNASGKTTFNRIILGLVRRDAGEIRFDGELLNGDSAYRARIGYMPQIARFPENLRGRDLVDMLTDLRGPHAARDEELIELLALGPVLDQPLRVLSGGTRQRINAALAFLFRPDLLILDEPTAGLDPISSSTLKDKILRERTAGRTCIVTSHVLSELEELADHVAFLLDGEIRFAGTPEELKRGTGQPTLERAIAQLMRRGLVAVPSTHAARGVA
ncbi:MAG TPA: ABC transporter ATP-binding protein [Gemmatimonadaceae bacterium]|nr:ABC transporter ATP-binding protein [Gemmatimonadaceae bacterium]